MYDDVGHCEVCGRIAKNLSQTRDGELACETCYKRCKKASKTGHRNYDDMDYDDYE